MLKKITLEEICKCNTFREALEVAYKENKKDIETGFLVQFNPQKNVIKINKPIKSTYIKVDLGDFKLYSYNLYAGKKGEGFYLEDGYHYLLHLHFHIPYSTHLPSEQDIQTLRKTRNYNLELAKKENFDYFINPLLVTLNKKREKNRKNERIDVCVATLIDEFSLYCLFSLNKLEDLPTKLKQLEQLNISLYQEINP